MTRWKIIELGVNRISELFVKASCLEIKRVEAGMRASPAARSFLCLREKLTSISVAAEFLLDP
jgi:hypothetical protein